MPAATPDARGPDRIPTSDSRTGPSGRPPPRVPANRAQPGKTEHHGSLMMTGRSRSRAHTDSSVPPVPNPISASDSRISPRKQAIRQTDAIRTHPGTVESRGSQTNTSQPPNRPRLRNRTKPNLDRRFLNQSTDTTGTICESGPHHPGTAIFRDSLPHTAESQHTVCGLIPNPTPNLRISPRTPPPQRTEVAYTNPGTAESRGSRNRYKSSHRQSPTSHTDQIQSRGTISEPVHDGGPHGRQSLPASSRKRQNPAVPETKTGHRAGNQDTLRGPNPISTHDSRFSPLKSPARLWPQSTITQEPRNTKAPGLGVSDTPPIAQPVADCIGFRRSIPESATDTAVPHANPNFNPASRSIVRFLAAHGTGPRLFMGILIPAHRPSVAPPVSRHPPLPPPASRVSRSPDSARQAANPNRRNGC